MSLHGHFFCASTTVNTIALVLFLPFVTKTARYNIMYFNTGSYMYVSGYFHAYTTRDGQLGSVQVLQFTTPHTGMLHTCIIVYAGSVTQDLSVNCYIERKLIKHARDNWT